MSCGITEEEIKEKLELEKQIKKLDLGKCKKCEGSPFIVLQKKDVFCKICFQEYADHKFRSTIAKAKLLKPNKNVLIAFSGGQNSVAMINLTILNMNKERLLLKPFLVYIDETIVLNDESKANHYNNQVDELLNNYNIDKYYSKLELYFNKSSFYSKDKRPDEDLKSKDEFIKTLDSFKSMTAKEEFLRKIRLNLVNRIAEAEQMSYVFLGSNGTRLAIQLITDVAQGQGNKVDSEICFADERDSNVKVLKPMREFISKEVAFWNSLMNCSYVEIEDLFTKRPVKSSIGKITEQFLNYLQKDYPATTHTIGKIGYKLQNQNSLKRRCLFCNSPIDDVEQGKYRAQTALVITDSFVPNNEASFKSDYCYGCNILLKDTTKPDDFLSVTKKLN